MNANQAVYPVTMICRVLEVSRSGFYAWRKREPSARAKATLLEAIEEVHKESDKTYGAPRIHAELKDRGPQASLNRVARVMREAEIRGVSPRKWKRTTLRAKKARPAPDLVDRDFTATGPNQVWVADITYISTWAGFLFLAIVLDVWSRRIVGWAMATHLRTDLVLEALDMALLRRPLEPGQYTSLAFGRRCELLGVRPSMGSVGDAYDNAMAESFFGTLECELLDRYSLRTPAEARLAVFRYIEGWYNPRRRHSSIDYLSPANFEAKHWPGSVGVPCLAELPAVAESLLAGLGSTPLQSSGSF